MIPLILAAIVAVLILIYLLAYWFFHMRVKHAEKKILDIFFLKVSKIPAFIEVMRPMVAEERAFDSIIALHNEAMIHEFDTIYSMLDTNSRLHRDFLFLNKLAVQIPNLQKNAQFLYIRDFIIDYERNMKKNFAGYNRAVSAWNRFITLKNATLIGLIFPGSKKDPI